MIINRARNSFLSRSLNSLQFITIIPIRINEYTTHKSARSKACSPQPPTKVSTKQPGKRALDIKP